MERLLRHHVGLTEVWQIDSPSARPLCRVPVSSLIYARALTDGFRDLEDSLGFRVAPSRNTEFRKRDQVALSTSLYCKENWWHRVKPDTLQL